MSMKIKIFFHSIQPITVTLFDNSAVSKWFDYSKELEYSCARRTLNYSEDQIESINSDKWTILKQALDHLRTLDYNIPFNYDSVVEIDQELLNRLHRFFTYNSSWWWRKELEPNPFDPDFKVPDHIKNFDDWNELISPINDAVHDLENHLPPSPNKLLFSEIPLDFINFTPAGIKRDFLGFTELEQQHNLEYMKIDSPTVILDDSILGKPYLQSFFDDDDPNAEDCTGRLGSFGGFWIDLNSNRKKIYNHPSFRQWLDRHRISFETTPLEFPIGVVETTNLIPYKPHLSRFSHIEFIK